MESVPESNNTSAVMQLITKGIGKAKGYGETGLLAWGKVGFTSGRCLRVGRSMLKKRVNQRQNQL